MKKLTITLFIAVLLTPRILHCMHTFDDEMQEYDPTTEIHYTAGEDAEVAPMPTEPQVISPASLNPCRPEDPHQEMYVFAQDFATKSIAASPFYSSAPQDTASITPIDRQQTPEAPLAEPFTPPISQPLPTPVPLSQPRTPPLISLFNQIIQKTRECQKCRKYITQQDFLKHVNAHKIYSYKCPFEACPFSCKSKISFRDHIRYHGDLELYVCHQYNPKALK
jgi:hypothetical protein